MCRGARCRLAGDVHKFEERIVGDLIVFICVKALEYKLLNSHIILVQKVLNSFAELVKLLFRYEVIEELTKLTYHDIT